MDLVTERAFDLAELNRENLGLRLADKDIEERARALLSRMKLSQKIAQMHGTSIQPVNDLYLTPDEPALGIPGFRMVDGPRGARAGIATTFPVAMARGASFDTKLEWRVGRAIAREAKARGANVLLAPAINLLRHPAWGRAQETYGEDPLHLGRMGVSFIAGAQTELVASVKHYALNSIEDTRFDVDVSVDARTLHEVYLPHFRACVRDAHVGSVMSAYNKVNGAYCAENVPILRHVLKDAWGFRGFVESDWIFGTRSTVGSIQAGLDIEMPQANFYGARLRDAVTRGDVSQALIDDAVLRILRVKLAFGLDQKSTIDTSVIECTEHLELALEVAQKSMVLLKNDSDVLPLAPSTLQRVAVVGRLSDLENTGDRGSSAVKSSFVTTALAGVTDRLGKERVEHIGSDVLSSEARARVGACDAAIVVVGLDFMDEGENIPFVEGGGDRDSLRLSEAQEALIADVSSICPRTVVVLIGGSAIDVTPFVAHVPALLFAFYPGMLGGEALADLLFGDVSPSGRLPFTMPRRVEDLPPFDHVGKAVTYGALHGYTLLEAHQRSALYPFGFGLSYTSFRYDALSLERDTSTEGSLLRCFVDVTNTGARNGDEVVQLYAQGSSANKKPAKVLVGFGRLTLSPGQTKRLELTLSADELGCFDEARGAWALEPGTYTVWAGPNAETLPLCAQFQVDPRQ